jgi:hypothetical protein
MMRREDNMISAAFMINDKRFINWIPKSALPRQEEVQLL